MAQLTASCGTVNLILCVYLDNTEAKCATMDRDESQGLLKSILGIFARKPQEKPAVPKSLRSQVLDAWVRTDAYLQHNADECDDIEPEKIARTLEAFENLVQYDYNEESESVSDIVPKRLPVSRLPICCSPIQGYEAWLTPFCPLSKAPSSS